MAINGDLDQALAATTLGGLWETWTDDRSAKERIWQDCIWNYAVQVDESKYDSFPWRCKVADSFSQETADTLASQLRNFLFPINEQYFEIQGQDLLGTARQARMQQFIGRQLQRTQFIERAMPWLKQLAVIGNAPYLLRWGPINRPRRRRQLEIDPLRRRSRVATIEKGSALGDGAFFEPLDAFDVAVDPSAVWLEDTPIIRRMKVSLDVLRTHAEEWGLENLDELEELAGSAPEQQSDSHKRQRQHLFGLQEQPESEPGEEIELLWIYGDLLIDGQSFTDHLAVVGNRSVLLRFERNPFWGGRPIGWGGYDPMWNSVYHKGPLEPVRGTQQLINTFQCQKADILNLIINGAFIYVDDGIIDPDLLFMKPGGGIAVGNIQNLKPIQPTANVALTYTEIEQLRGRGERSSGVSRFDQGQAPGGRRTAFEANLIRSGGSTRLSDVLRHVANGPLEYALNWIVWTNQQMQWDEGVLDNQTLLGDYYTQFVGADISVVRSFELERQLQAIQIMTQVPEFAAAVNKRALAERIFRNLFMNDPDLINTPEQMQAELAQLARRASAQGAPGQEGVVGGADEGLRSLVENLA